MYKASLFEDRQSIQKLCHEYLDELCTQTLELILFDQLVKVGRKQLEHKTEMTSMDERVPQT